MEKETEAVVGEEGTRLEVLQNEGWSFTGVLYKEGYWLRSKLRVLLYKEWSFCRVLYKEGY